MQSGPSSCCPAALCTGLYSNELGIGRRCLVPMTTALCEPGLPLEALRDGSLVGVGLKGTHIHTFKDTLKLNILEVNNLNSFGILPLFSVVTTRASAASPQPFRV